MDALAERLNIGLREWKPDTAARVREHVAELVELADLEVLDLVRSRATEQEVLDLLDASPGPGEARYLGGHFDVVHRLSAAPGPILRLAA